MDSTPSPFRLNRILLGLFLFVVGATGLHCSSDPSTSEQLNVSFEETLRLGTDQSDAPNHRLFSDPVQVAVGDDGTLFVVDRGAPAIRVYDETGTFQRSIGDEGNGPGEFQRITALHAGDGQLLVADQRQARITALSPTGTVEATYQLSDVPRITQIAEYTDDQYLVVGAGKGHLVHVVDSSFSGVEASLIAESDVQTTDHKLERVVRQFMPGHVAMANSDRVVYAPSLYPGRLYEYTRTDTAWTQTDVYRGHGTHDPPATFSPLKQAERVDLPISLQQGRYGVQFHSISWGLTVNANGTITHVFSQEHGDGLQLTFERFKADGMLLGATVIDMASTPLALDALEIRPTGTLFLSDTRNVPQLRRLRWNRR